MTTAVLHRRPAEQARSRLRPRTRKIVLLAHVAASGTWLGIDAALGVLVGAALLAEEGQAALIPLASVAAIATWPMVLAGTATLASGILLGWGSKYGLVRYWWVLAKLLANLVLVALVLLVLGPEVRSLSDAATTALAGGPPPPDFSTLVFPPLVSSTAIVLAIALSIFKPWGRTGRPANRWRTG